MPRPFQRPVIGKRVRGLMYFKQLKPLFARLHRLGAERDRAGNRKLFYDQYVGLILLFFFNPTFRSLRGLQRASCIAQIRKKLKCSRTSLGSLSEAARVFDAEALQSMVGELAQQALPLNKGKDADILRGLTAVDGTLLPALPKMAWALWIDETHRAAKLHLHFDVFKGVPCHASITDGNGNERDELRAALQSKRLYVIDRGYAEYQLFQDIIDARSSFIGRIRDNAVYEIVEEPTLSDDARQAGVLWDRVVWLGCEQSGAVFKQKLRVVAVANGKTDSKGQPEVLLLASNCLDLDAAWIALGYKYRWTIELFFRWFKCILGCQHLLSTCHNGVAIQVYMALIVSMVMVLWTGHKPTKATLEMLTCYFTGLASDAELMAHLRSLDEPKKKKS
jgi:Transposase DDE domain